MVCQLKVDFFVEKGWRNLIILYDRSTHQSLNILISLNAALVDHTTHWYLAAAPGLEDRLPRKGAGWFC